MTIVNKAPRHRLDNRTITPLSDLTQTAQFGRISLRSAAGATATGLALTAIAGTASAVPTTVDPQSGVDAGVDQFAAALELDSTGTIVSIDQTWDPGDSVAAEVEEPVTVQDSVEEEVASRSETRTEITGIVEAEEVSVPVASVDTSSIAAAALSVTGVPYVYGGSSLSGMDCSGLVAYVYAQFGFSLPHQSESIYASGTAIPSSEAVPGDVIWYPGHVAIYVGDGQMVEATVPGSLSTVASVRAGGTFVRI